MEDRSPNPEKEIQIQPETVSAQTLRTCSIAQKLRTSLRYLIWCAASTLLHMKSL